ncbi:hypothetical protein CVT26_007470 [Gymnopilus dilepis]|uniref:Uncharacterized protein n=1 Tax=Gymnopilus dilepis TaxID=231916 RepID=A0A409W7U2_9AGAR|nr:hypothetical protein CVT26_007470 [Gymnopilus dilepis]
MSPAALAKHVAMYFNQAYEEGRFEEYMAHSVQVFLGFWPEGKEDVERFKRFVAMAAIGQVSANPSTHWENAIDVDYIHRMRSVKKVLVSKRRGKDVLYY